MSDDEGGKALDKLVKGKEMEGGGGSQLVVLEENYLKKRRKKRPVKANWN